VVDVHVQPGSRLADVLASTEGSGLTVGCHHHQSVRSHPGYEAVAWAGDGTVEAIETAGDRFLLGVQWHPEVAEDAGLFRALVRAGQG
jgi:putative glutamine amidotransferase